MIAHPVDHRRVSLQLAKRGAQERSTSITPMALYSTAMNQPEADRPEIWCPATTAKAAIDADRNRSSRAHRQILVAGGGLKIHSRRNRSGRGSVQQALSGIRHR